MKNIFGKNKDIKQLNEATQIESDIKNETENTGFMNSLKNATVNLSEIKRQKKKAKVETLICEGSGLGIQKKIDY